MERIALETRHTAILERMQRNHQATVAELAQEFGVSGMTIRRDLAYLEELGLLVRTHGGCVPAARLMFMQTAFSNLRNAGIKATIGKAAASIVKPDEIIMVDSGTTTLEVVRHLPQDTGITVATTSLCVAQELYGSSVDVFVMGGLMRKGFPGLSGPLTERNIAEFQVDTLFVGCDAADSDTGFYMDDLSTSSLEKTMIGVAKRVVLVTESKKFGKRAFVRFATPSQVHTLVTDSSISKADQIKLKDQGVNIIIAPER